MQRIEEEIARLITEAEEVEARAEVARHRQKRRPDNRHYRNAEVLLNARAARLRAEAVALGWRPEHQEYECLHQARFEIVSPNGHSMMVHGEPEMSPRAEALLGRVADAIWAQFA